MALKRFFHAITGMTYTKKEWIDILKVQEIDRMTVDPKIIEKKFDGMLDKKELVPIN